MRTPNSAPSNPNSGSYSDGGDPGWQQPPPQQPPPPVQLFLSKQQPNPLVRTLEFVVPPGTLVGQSIKLNYNEKVLRVTVPNGATPGTRLRIQLPITPPQLDGGRQTIKEDVADAYTATMNSARRLKRSASVSVIDSLDSLKSRMSSEQDQRQAAGHGGNPLSEVALLGWGVHTGYLWKQGDFTGFKRRFFVLRGELVTYYEKDPLLGDSAEPQKGAIQLRGAVASSIDSDSESGGSEYPYMFKIVLDSTDEHLRTQYILAAGTEQQKKVWIKKLNVASGVESRRSQREKQEEAHAEQIEALKMELKCPQEASRTCS